MLGVTIVALLKDVTIIRGFPTRMVYLYNDTESRYTILVGNPRIMVYKLS